MLKDTFNIQLLHTENQAVNFLICEGCITRLRDATSFKNMVQQNEENYKKIMESFKYNEKGSKMADNELKIEDIKCESPLMEPAEESYDDDEILANIKMEITQNDSILNSETGKKYAYKKKTKLKKCKIDSDKGLSSHKDWSKILERRGNGPILRENSLKLLANSTIFVFQWNKSRFRCFCCKEPFCDVDALREHTNTHTLKSIEKKIIDQQNRLVKVEISILNCKLCNQSIDDLNLLRTHLIDEHNLNFELEEDLLVPFKIGGELSCQLCKEKFTVFRLLNIHMNKHFRKQVCHICGAGFSNLVFLNLHKTRSHKPLKCRQCDVTFANKADKKNHEVNVHGIKFERRLRFPCPYCSERFFQENFRVLHLVEKHGLKKPEYKCDICCKVFVTKSLCNNHFRNVHLKEKSHECDICHNLFYTKSDVSRHKITHTGEKKFSCVMCNNPFASKDSLRRHMKRTHGVH
ncbi:zinc finger protein 33B-like isoform X2 [Trichoplusia ni]|nr:zinc finger protein 33B-like isoform X2 [Trichoplusia ni]